MPNTRRHSYDLNLKFKIVAETEAVNNNREIAREYGISKSMAHKWCNQQDILFSGELKMTAKHATMGHYRPKDPELDQLLADWFSDQRSQGKQMPILVMPMYWWISCSLHLLIDAVFVSYPGLSVNGMMLRV